jgi:hypothetical protein
MTDALSKCEIALVPSPARAATRRPDVVPDGPNKVMDAPDTAVGARKRKARKGKTCAHLSTLSLSRPSGSSLVGGASARAGDQDRAGDGRGRQRGGAAMTIAARGATNA